MGLQGLLLWLLDHLKRLLPLLLAVLEMLKRKQLLLLLIRKPERHDRLEVNLFLGMYMLAKLFLITIILFIWSEPLLLKLLAIEDSPEKMELLELKEILEM